MAEVTAPSSTPGSCAPDPRLGGTSPTLDRPLLSAEGLTAPRRPTSRRHTVTVRKWPRRPSLTLACRASHQNSDVQLGRTSRSTAQASAVRAGCPRRHGWRAKSTVRVGADVVRGAARPSAASASSRAPDICRVVVHPPDHRDGRVDVEVDRFSVNRPSRRCRWAWATSKCGYTHDNAHNDDRVWPSDIASVRVLSAVPARASAHELSSLSYLAIDREPPAELDIHLVLAAREHVAKVRCGGRRAGHGRVLVERGLSCTGLKRWVPSRSRQDARRSASAGTSALCHCRNRVRVATAQILRSAAWS